MAGQPIVLPSEPVARDPAIRTRDLLELARGFPAVPSSPAGRTVFMAPLAWTVPEFDPAEAEARLRATRKKEQLELVERFIARVAENPSVVAIYVAWEPEADVTVTVAQRELEEELRLFAIFREVSSSLSDRTMGNLAVLLAPFAPDDAELVYSR